MSCRISHILNLGDYFLMALKYSSISPWTRQWHPTPILLPGKSHGWRSLEGCSPWGRRGLDTTERFHFHFHELEKEMATHSSVQRRGSPGLPPMGLHSVGYDWSDLAAIAAATCSSCLFVNGYHLRLVDWFFKKAENRMGEGGSLTEFMIIAGHLKIFIYFYSIIYLTVPDVSCSTWDL